MKTSYTKYVIATKERPTLFIAPGCSECDDLESAMLLTSESDAEYVISTFDDPERFAVLAIELSLEL